MLSSFDHLVLYSINLKMEGNFDEITAIVAIAVAYPPETENTISLSLFSIQQRCRNFSFFLLRLVAMQTSLGTCR